MREHGIPQFTVDAHRPVGAFDLLGVSFATELGYTNMLTALDLAGIPLLAADRDRGPPGRASPAGTRRSTRSRSPTSSTRRCSATASRRCCAITDVVARVEGRGQPGRPRRAAAAAGRRPAASTCRASTTSTTCRTAGSSGSRPTAPACRGGCTSTPSWTSTQWPYPKQPLVPLAETVHERMSVEIFRGCTRGCRFCQAGHDHPPGARALDHRHRRDGRARARRDRLRGGRPAVAVVAPTTPRSPRSRRGWPTATRAPTLACRCRRPASTRSTSTWPTSCPATAGAPA